MRFLNKQFLLVSQSYTSLAPQFDTRYNNNFNLQAVTIMNAMIYQLRITQLKKKKKPVFFFPFLPQESFHVPSSHPQ